MRQRENVKRRRQVQIRKNIAITIFTFAVIVILAIGTNSLVSSANAENQLQSQKYFKSIMINQGDTLWSIADENKGVYYESTEKYIQEVRSINHLRDDELLCGEFLIIPYYGENIQ